MASLVLSGDTSGSVTLAAPAVAGSTTQTLVNVTGTLAPIVSGTAQASTSGTSIDFTGIPSWVKRVTVMMSGISTNGSSSYQLQLGTASGVETSGYLGSTWLANTTNTSYSAGFLVAVSPFVASGTLYHCVATLTIVNSSTNLWMFGMVGGRVSATGVMGSGSKPLSGTLDRVRVTTDNGTDIFNAGTINILYE